MDKKQLNGSAGKEQKRTDEVADKATDDKGIKYTAEARKPVGKDAVVSGRNQ